MEEERTYNFFRFEDLRLYDKTLDYIDWVYNTTKLFPEIESGSLSSKFRDSSQNIALNIAEGSGRNKNQFIYQLKLAKTAIRECIFFTTLAKRFGYILEDAETESRNQLIEISKMLGALIASLQRNNKNGGNGNGSNYGNNYGNSYHHGNQNHHQSMIEDENID